MNDIFRKTKAYLELLKDAIVESSEAIHDGIEIYPCNYKKTGEIPDHVVFRPFSPQSELWGTGTDTHAWFRLTVDIPNTEENEQIRLEFLEETKGENALKPQFLVYVNEKLKQGLDINHTEIVFDEAGTYKIHVYAYTGFKCEKAPFRPVLKKVRADVEKLWYDLKVPFESLAYLNENSREYRGILNHLGNALNLLDVYEIPSDSFYKSVKQSTTYMENVFYGDFCTPPTKHDAVTVGIGHTHIDCAWLWTLKQTREKVQRSFSTVLELMRRYPQYQFFSSQPYLYKLLKEEEPELYEEVRELVRQGRWECDGAMWVEADCNLTSGESLVRQILFGKRFFREEFGVESHVLWLPDVFGYSAALPQILKKSGVDWFVTSKISWNDTNQMPYDTFIWKGIDGTSINTYFLTAQHKWKNQSPANYADYNAKVIPAMISGAQERYQQKELSNEVLISFGYGDGGGGTTVSDLEYAKRLVNGIPGTPAFRIKRVGDFLEQLGKNIENHPQLPVWQGELYLEFHRGTYTSQCKNKRYNRQSEILYLSTEFVSSMTKSLLGTKYPKDELRYGWEMILTNQFHDIIPGSSIREVYEQCDLDYAEIFSIGNGQMNKFCSVLAQGIGRTHEFAVLNPNPMVGNGIIQKDGVSVYVSNIPSKGYVVCPRLVVDNQIKLTPTECETRRYRVRFDERMQIVSIWDKNAERELLKKHGIGNQLRVYADRPDKFDAWEWNEFSMSKFEVIDGVESVEIIEDGVRSGLRIVRPYRKSKVKQTIWFCDYMDRIDFETEMDWQEHHMMLKTAFDVDINSPRATYEIQYGTIERPTHKNTSWDRAKFEVCGHRFADLSDGNYGVALLNDCKYGYDIHDGVMMLSLLKSATYPDPQADLGIMKCTYSVYAHEGTANICDLYALAYDLNNPMRAIEATGAKDLIPLEFCFVQCNRPNVLCEVIKEAEDSEDLVVRLFECQNSTTNTTITFGVDVEKVCLCDMNENKIQELTLNGRSVELNFHGFEIHTLMVTTQKGIYQ